jgi:hypothetical protein
MQKDSRCHKYKDDEDQGADGWPPFGCAPYETEDMQVEPMRGFCQDRVLHFWTKHLSSKD